jgi:hypothetical protein
MAAAVDDEPGDERLSALVRMAREDFDEEPPPRIDALLMAAARKHAPEPRVGVFARVRRWLAASMLNPALAGATALVVIGGTAGVLYMKDQGRIAQPTVSRPGAPERALAPETLPGELALRFEELDDKDAVAEVNAPVTPEPKPDPRPKQRGQHDRRVEPPPEPRLPPPPPAGEGVTIATGGLRSDMGGGEGVTAIPDETERKLEERPADQRPDDAVAGVAQTESTVAPDSAPSNRTQAENLHRQAKNAAKQRQCAPVKVMAQRAKKLDADYYTLNFAVDPEIKPCL